MGNCFSDPSESKTKGQRLGSAPSSTTSAAQPIAPTAKPPTATSPGRALGDGYEDVNRERDPREMARIAAEDRAKSNAKRGVQSSNPKAGQLTAKLDASRKKSVQPTTDESRPMDPGNYN